MKFRRFPFSIILFVIIALVTIILVANAKTEMQDNPDKKEIIKAMETGYEAIAYAAHTNDVSLLSNILIDTTDYDPPVEVKENIKKVYGSQVAEKTGYLTAMQAKYISRGKVDEKLKKALTKARAENRELTKEEFGEIVMENNGQVPATGVYSSPNGKTQLTFKEIKIQGEKAIVYYDDGAASQKAILYKIKGKWFIANIEILVVHL